MTLDQAIKEIRAVRQRIQCEHVAWQTFNAFPDLQQLDAELIGISLGPRGAQQLAVLTTDVFELSFVYGSFSLQTPTSASYSR
jgi:hypothetical protein